jgi:hypothetical protein
MLTFELIGTSKKVSPLPLKIKNINNYRKNKE